MWNSTKITKLLGIEYPILQGPMGGGFSTASLLAVVSNSGGLGSFGAYTLTPDEIREAGKEIQLATSKPYNINLWVNDADKSLENYAPEKLEKVKLLFKPYFDELGIPLPDLSTAIPSKFEKQVEVLFELKPAVFSFIFGIPSKEILKESKKLGIKTIGAATTLEEALALEDAEVDAIVAAGFEAGGHRPSFLKPAQDSFTGLFTLIQQLKAKTKTPIIAVQLGTAFMVTDESAALDIHKEIIFNHPNATTTVSKLMTGRMGRMIPNKITENVSVETEVLPFPLQTRLMATLKTAALNQGRTDLVNFWSGQNTGNLKYHKTSELMQALIAEMSA